ncbi:ABC transporter permease [Roseibium sp.]|uniref:ABC transporter permease n=1 Tax=Roseibium sp. TaxID=1936156 RepID=UPI0032647760
MSEQTELSGLKAWLSTDVPASRFQAKSIQFYLGWLKLVSNPLAFLGFLILLVLVFCAMFAPFLAPVDPLTQDLAKRLSPPGVNGYLLGSDELGRDILSRIIYGSRITLFIVTLVAVTAPVFGLLVGTFAGYLGGWIDEVLMRVTDIFLAFPKLVLALAFVAALGAGIENAILAISITAWPAYARIARAETLTIRNSDFISAVRLQGAGTLHIIVRHIWPLCLSSIIVRMTLDMAGIILTAAGLGFLGLGAQPPMPEWGAMISAGRKFILDQWWVATMPGLAIFIVSLGFNLLGDGLRDILDPKKSKS